MTTDPQKVKRPEISLIEVGLCVVILFIVGIKFTNVLILALMAVLYIAYPIYQRRSWLIAACVALLVSILVPIDILLGHEWGSQHGSTHSGPRLVHCAGMCNAPHTELLRTYGEYATHTSAEFMFGPRWIFVWD